jgi:hypothetical protein
MLLWVPLIAEATCRGAATRHQSGSQPWGYHAEQVERYLALHAKYERARFEVLGAEHQKRVDKPTMN